MPHDDQIQSLETRVSRLEDLSKEHSSQFREIVALLKSIESRLIGNLSDSTPGILEEIRQLKLVSSGNSEKLISLAEEVEELKKKQGLTDTAMQKVDTLNANLENLNRYKLIGYGIGITLLAILGYAFKVWEIFSGKK